MLIDVRLLGEVFLRSDDSVDAHGLGHKLLFKKLGVDKLEFIKDEDGLTKLTIKLKDGNQYRSIGFKEDAQGSDLQVLTDAFIRALSIKRWDSKEEDQ